MGIVGKLRSYLLEDDFVVHILENQINVVNYTSIGEIGGEKVMIRYLGGLLIIKGERLVVSRLLKDEVLITGKLKTIEFR